MRSYSVYITVFIVFLATTLKGQDDFKTYKYYQISDAWYITPIDTVNIGDDFSSDYFFAFFIEDNEGQNFFTIRGYEHNEIFCLGEIEVELVEDFEDHKAIIYTSEVYFSTTHDETVKRIVLESIPNSKIETGYEFFNLWLVISEDEALVFQCFDIHKASKEEETN